jgi:DNA-binding NarL/FixJ family response regulator
MIGWTSHAYTQFGDPISDALSDTRPVSPWLRPIIDALLVEAAIGCARTDLAAAHSARVSIPVDLFGRPNHPFRTFMRLTASRAHWLAGEIDTAQLLLEGVVEDSPNPLMRAFAQANVTATLALADQRTAVRQALREVDAGDVAPDHPLACAVYVIASYAAMLQGDMTAAAELVLRAATSPDLSNLQFSDWVICIETLVRAALEAGDLDAASAWRQRFEPLSGHPMCGSTQDRIDARIALASGDAHTAVVLAERSITKATHQGGGLEVAECEYLLARARVAAGLSGVAQRTLSHVVERAETLGHRSARASAARELRGTGRRLLPHQASRWLGLSEREREIARMVATGISNSDIGERLHLSPHTVRTHLTRILYAFGVPSRAAIGSYLPVGDGPIRGATTDGTTNVHREPGYLTFRQQETATLVAQGMSNREIAARLGVSTNTVAKHVAAIMHRWQLPSRAGIGTAMAGAIQSG